MSYLFSITYLSQGVLFKQRNDFCLFKYDIISFIAKHLIKFLRLRSILFWR